MADRQTILLQIKGMTCDGCATHVRTALSGVAGVSEIELPDWRAAKAELLAESGVRDATLVKALEDAGYRAIVHERRAVDQGRKGSLAPER